ncbi:hypothetical protein N8I77_009771 [Diaporthe amygdali]|uniref:Uncharacterized protein n=1 Tax=Phomopsis amygdali TaxID=1214568 RepID=A0AAD9W1A5_PHOAM|nr:hypothetical protein N8I77_009771 [Diaporthe amygdali]
MSAIFNEKISAAVLELSLQILPNTYFHLKMAIGVTPESVLDGATLEEMTKYRIAAESIAQRQFRRGKRHLWMPEKDTTSDGISRVQAFVLEGDYKDSEGLGFDNDFELIQYYETPPIDGGGAKINRRLYVVENPDTWICEYLGVKLGIPPEVFLAHCDENIDLSLVDDGFTRRDHSKYWKVSVPHLRVCRSQVERLGKHYFHTGCIDRQGVDVQEYHREFLFFNLVSYWAKSYGQDGDSWTAIILVDLDNTRLRFENPNPGDSHFTELEAFDPIRRLGTEVVMNRTKIEITSQPYARSFFDTLISAHKAQLRRTGQGAPHHSEEFFSPIYTEDPFSITFFAQNLVLAAWEEFIIRSDRGFRDDQLADETEHFVSPYPLSTKRILRRDYDNVEKYHAWIDRKREVERWRWRLDTIMDAFKTHRLDGNVPTGRAAPMAEKGAIEGNSSHLGGLGVERKGRAWSRLQKKLAELQADITSHMEMFAQRAAFEHAFAANRQARSAAQLTKIATVIVPCTFVASIFSMGGDFAAGEKLFGIYWIVSIPVTLALLAWILHDDMTRPWKLPVPVSDMLTSTHSYLNDARARLRGHDTASLHAASQEGRMGDV